MQDRKEFLYSIADESVQSHYASRINEIQPIEDSFVGLEEQFQVAVRQLAERDLEVVQAYLDCLSRKFSLTVLFMKNWTGIYMLG